MAKLIIRHDLHLLSKEELTQYLRDVSSFIGLDPDLNGLDVIYMPNETGAGQSLVVYARRGTCEILRNLLGIDVEELTDKVINGPIVFTAKGRNKEGRKEQAVGSKFIGNLTGKALDDAIMTSSTRSLRRLTLQFTTLGILDESEVVAVVGQQVNPAASAQLASGSTLPPAFLPPPSVPANNAPGKAIEYIGPSQDPKTQAQVAAVIAIREAEKAATTAPVSQGEPFVGQKEQIAEAWKQIADKKADKTSAQVPPSEPVKPVESATSKEPEAAPVADKEADIAPAPRRGRPRKPRGTVSLDVESETVSSKTPVSPIAEKTPISEIVVPQVTHNITYAPVSSPLVAPPFGVSNSLSADVPLAVPQIAMTAQAEMPSPEQMAEYRKKISVYTAELPPSENLGSTQKMRAFITKIGGAPPQQMNLEQWQDMISWFDAYLEKHTVKDLVEYINILLGVK